MAKPSVAIIIPAYNAAATLERVLAAAFAQTPRAAAVILVDDGSTDGTAGILRRFPEATYLRQDNAGPARARNAGWRAAGADIAIFTDSDCVPAPNWVSTLLEGFSNDRIAAVTGSYGIANPEYLLPRLIHEEIKNRHHTYPDFVKFFGSYNVAIRRTVLEQTGGFDESYRRASGEDNDLSYRVLEAGYRIAYAPDALVAHHHTRLLGRYLREQYRHGYWRMKLYREHPGMAGGDDYTRTKDIVEPPLSMLCLLSVASLPLVPWLMPLLAAILLVMQAPAAVRIAIRLRKPGYLALAPLTFVRGFARGLGMTSGFARFFIVRR